MNRIFLPLLIFLFIALPHIAARGESARVLGRVDCDSWQCRLTDMEIIGEIDFSTAENVKRLIDESHERATREKKGVEALGSIALNSRGGSVAAAMAIGRMLRKERLTVIVPHWAVCHSACVLIYAGGVSRGNAGKLGIHRPYLEVSQQEVSSENVKELYQRMLQDIRSYFREMNVSEQLADAMLRIDPDKIRLLNDAALDSYGLTQFDPIEQETLDLQDAKSWGLSRQEYMRRKSLTERACPGILGVPDTRSGCYQAVMKTGRLPARAPAQGRPNDDPSCFGPNPYPSCYGRNP